MEHLQKHISNELVNKLKRIESHFEADVITIHCPIYSGLEVLVRNALESIISKKEKLVIILDTTGGSIEIVQRMVDSIRHFYKNVYFIIPNQAMSAGTVFALSGNKIFMDYSSCLGPIDPQIEAGNGHFVPALAYINKFNDLVEKSKNNPLTEAELALLTKLDLAALEKYEQAKELSIELLKKWLTEYKFKDWDVTRTQKKQVNQEFKRTRAKSIAEKLSNNRKWHSHGRPLNINTLVNDINLEIDDFGTDQELTKYVREYFDLILDHMKNSKLSYFIHTAYYSS